ncbi:unnamed protein product [Polarella glacialis]|uniref:Uncharacterized protein n=1 Tax=Polarella glacialis TaxID=89957 RepID=A0A813L0S9_POLGL|nr:unnamed protein product [Polarella glacialis]
MEQPVFRRLVSLGTSLECLPADGLLSVRSPGAQQPGIRCMATTVLRKTSPHQVVRGMADSNARASLLLMPNVKAVDYDDDVPTWTSSCSRVVSLQHEGHPAMKAPKH